MGTVAPNKKTKKRTCTAASLAIFTQANDEKPPNTYRLSKGSYSQMYNHGAKKETKDK